MTPLRQRMLEDMSIRNLAENTQQSHLSGVPDCRGRCGTLTAFFSHINSCLCIRGDIDVRTHHHSLRGAHVVQ